MLDGMMLKDLIQWLEQQDPDVVVEGGFGEPHSDRGSYDELAFDPAEYARIGDMLQHAKSARGQTFTGWKGGEFEMGDYTSTLIGRHGECGEPITSANLRLWVLTGDKP